MSEKPPPKPTKTKEEREAEEEKIYDKIAEKVAKRLEAIKPTQPTYPYSVCPICGYTFISPEEEDKYSTCPGGCGFTGQTVKLIWQKSEK
jgi:hypothetical protein